MDAFTSSGHYLGTERIGRALTDAESQRLATLLREHDFVGASMVALRFAYKLARNKERARDLLGRTNLRLVRLGWDPNAVTLVKCLCRLVWSEHSNAKSEMAAARRAEEVFLREQEEESGALRHAAPNRGDPERRQQERGAPSYEDQIVRLETEREEDERRARRLAEMRADLATLRDGFEARKDEVNLVYLDKGLQGTLDVAKMAQESGRDVKEFYAAAKRRSRAVEKLVAEKNGASGGDEENEDRP